MKNALSYYYDLYSSDIHLNGDNYYFSTNNGMYVLYLFQGSMEDAKNVYDMHIYVMSKGIYTHQIILNKEEQIITLIDQKPYVLLKVNGDFQKKISIEEIEYYTNRTSGIKKENNWKQLWSNKIDYFEYQMSQFGKKYPLLRESFSYYAGIAENGIALLNYTKDVPCSICHKRIHFDNSQIEFYNPFNYIVDTKVRDTAGFFKSKIFDSDDLIMEIQEYLEHSQLTADELYYFFIRMLFPTFYFDRYEKIINGDMEEYKIKEAIEVAPIYEKTIQWLYQYLKRYIKIPEIEWLDRIGW